MMDAAEIARLREIAEKATPGPWEWGKQKFMKHPIGSLYAGERCIADFGDDTNYYPTAGELPSYSDQQYISAMDPTTALALLDALEQAQKERDEAWKAVRVRDETINVTVKKRTVQRDAAQEDAQAARALLNDVVNTCVDPFNTPDVLLARIEAMLEKKP